ncbi:MAG: leucine-rich repeat protein [Bacteroidales bacterium]|nr:leucine-rich repeat protein [Bacteroidales bacterium]
MAASKAKHPVPIKTNTAMKKRLMLILFALLSGWSAGAYDFEVDGIYYNYRREGNDGNIIDGEVAVTYKDYPYYYDNERTDYSGSVVIPATVTYDGKTYRVTAIRNGAFGYCTGLTSVTIPNSVTSIGEGAFEQCAGLKSVYYTGNISQWCGIDRKLWISFGWDLYIDDVKVTDLMIPEGVTAIGECAFFCCTGLASVTLPESVTSIGWNAFGACSGLTSVMLPESVDSIGVTAFWGTSISSPLYNSRIFAYMPENYRGEYAIPSGIQMIAPYAFNDCHGPISVTIPESMTSIGASAFNGCSGLTSVEIPEGVTTIGESAFFWCTGLTSVTLPESVTEIGEYAFLGGTSIGSPLYNSRIFAYMPKNYSGEYAIPSGIQTIAPGAFSDCRGPISVEIPNSVTSIREWTFEECTGLTSVTLPASLDTIVACAFGGCNNLGEVYSLSKVPPYCEPHPYEDGYVYHPFEIYETLYVPRGCKAAYQSAMEWRNFANIEEITTAKVTVRANDASMGLVVGGGDYELDAQATVAAIPNPGYYFVRWDDGNTANPRILTVTEDITLTAVFAKNGDTPPPTANESALSAAPIAYVQGRTAYLADGLGEVEAFTLTGQRVYRGTDRTITLPRPGIYVLRVVADGRRCKVVVK